MPSRKPGIGPAVLPAALQGNRLGALAVVAVLRIDTRPVNGTVLPPAEERSCRNYLEKNKPED